MALAYRFKAHERPVIPGSPFNPDHPAGRMVAYGLIGILAGLTGGLGNSLVTANIAYFQGTLGLTAREAAFIPAAYATTNVCANLLLVKFRQQFGLALFARLSLITYVLVTLTHLFAHSFSSALAVRAVSGVAAAGLTTLGTLALFQAMPAAVRPIGILLGVSIPQLATPLARVLAPSLLEWGDWRMSYFFELALALLTLAAVTALPFPPSERSKAFERTDFVTIALLFPGIGLLCCVLALGRTDWWMEAPWIGWALIGSIMLIATALIIEHWRSNPLLVTRFLGRWPILRLLTVILCIRIITFEQSYASVGLLSAVGMGTDQLRSLFLVVTLASIGGLLAAIFLLRPQSPARPLQVACLLIAIAAFMDSSATNLTRPANIYVSQALVGFAALLFIGPAMLIGVSRALLAGPQNFISWLVLVLATQSIGSLMGSALFGTIQTVREKFHSSILTQQILQTNPIDAARLAGAAQQLNPVVADPSLRAAEGGVLLNQQVSREAAILAFNDVFIVIGVMALLLFVWGVVIEINMRRRGEVSPLVLFGQLVAAQIAAAKAEGQKS